MVETAKHMERIAKRILICFFGFKLKFYFFITVSIYLNRIEKTLSQVFATGSLLENFQDILNLKTPIVFLHVNNAAWHVFMLLLFSIEIQIALALHDNSSTE